MLHLNDPTATQRRLGSSHFEQTSLTVLDRAHKGDTLALEELCSRYWQPLYVWLLRSGLARSDADAADYVQDFFAKMVKNQRLTAHDPERGKFRTYLVRCLKNLVIDARRKARVEIVDPVGSEDLDEWFEKQPDTAAADLEFEKEWARGVYDSAKASVRQTWDHDGDGPLFDAFLPRLDASDGDEGLESIGHRFDLSHANVRVRLHRLRKQVAEAARCRLSTELPPDATPEELAAAWREFIALLVALKRGC